MPWLSPLLLPELRKNIGIPLYLPVDLSRTQSRTLLSPYYIVAGALGAWTPLPETVRLYPYWRSPSPVCAVRPHVARYNSSPLPRLAACLAHSLPCFPT